MCLDTLLTPGNRTGVKIIRAPKKRVESEQDTPSPYSTPPAPAPASAASATAPKQVCVVALIMPLLTSL